MAQVELASGNRSFENDVDGPPKRFKASELPLSQSQRSVIDGILHTFKKKGEFDALRKQVWDQYSESAEKASFITSLEDLAETEIERDPSILSRDRGKAATLMQGAVDRSDVYKSVESSLDRLLAEHLGHVEATLREVRRTEVGEDVAAEEQRRGKKTDQEYAAESAVRRQARAEQKKKDEARKRREEEKETLRAEEAKKKVELEKLRRREERRKEEEAKAAKRAKDREINRALLKKAEEEERIKRQERNEKRAREEAEKNALENRSRKRVRSAHPEPESVPPTQDTPMPDAVSAASPDTPAPPPIDEKDLEAIALERLLNEGRELAAKSGSKLDNERSDSLGPPSLRGGQSVKPLKLGEPSPPKGPASDRINSPLKIDPPKGPRLSFNQTSRHAFSPYPADVRPRSRSPSRGHSYNTSSRRDSASDLRRTYDSEAKAAWKKQALGRREDEGEYYKSSTPRESSHKIEHEDEHHRHQHPRDYYDTEDRPKDRPHQDYYGERDRYKERSSRDHRDDHRSTHHEHEKEYRPSHSEHDKDHRPSRHDRSRSRDRATYRADRTDSDHHHHHHHHRSSRYYEDTHEDSSHRSARHYDRSRSPHHHQSQKQYDKPSSYGDTRSRASDRPAPVEIDRYVPSTSSRARESRHSGEGEVPSTSSRAKEHRHSGEGAEDNEREKERGDKEKPDYRDRDRDRDREREKDSHRERDGYKARESYKDRDNYKERDSYKDRDNYKERDNYKDRDNYKERDNYKDRDNYKERDSYKEREGFKERDRYGERDAKDKKAYVEIDRYIPGGSRARDGERERPRERDRDRDRERDRERERSR